MRTFDQQNALDVIAGIAAALNEALAVTPFKAPLKPVRLSWAQQLRDCATVAGYGTAQAVRLGSVARRLSTRWSQAHTWAEQRDLIVVGTELSQQWPLRLGWPLEGGPDAHPITRSAEQHLADSEGLAVDFAGEQTPIGTVCVANFDGVVRFAGYDWDLRHSAGWFVEVEGDVDGIGHVIAGWCHMGTDDDGGLLVATGDGVVVGTPLGAVGYSGWTIPAGPAGAHLHYRLEIDGVRVDPAQWIA